MNIIMLKSRLILVCAVAVLGCNSARDRWYESRISSVSRRDSTAAWDDVCHVYENCQPNLKDFKKGFKDGYQNVAKGGDGCPPILPPKKYWSARYQCEAGQCSTVAYFNGFSHGVAVARSDGLEGRGVLLTSDQIYQNCREVEVIELPGELSKSQEEEVLPEPMPEPEALIPEAPAELAPKLYTPK